MREGTSRSASLRHVWLLASLIGLLVFVLVGPTTAAAATPSNHAELVAKVIQLTNAERTKRGLAPLKENSALVSAAQSYAEKLSSGSCFSHSCGSTLTERLRWAGYTNWTFIGENIAAGYSSPESVVAAWMRSSSHRANILKKEFKEIGVGVATGGRYGIYWVQDFGARRG